MALERHINKQCNTENGHYVVEYSTFMKYSKEIWLMLKGLWRVVYFPAKSYKATVTQLKLSEHLCQLTMLPYMVRQVEHSTDKRTTLVALDSLSGPRGQIVFSIALLLYKYF